VTDEEQRAAEVMNLHISTFNEEFSRLAQQRHDMGAEKYGPVKFMEVDSLNEAAEELVDFANYARYTFIKIRLLQAYLAEQSSTLPEGFDDKVEGLLGRDSFKKGL
jgi:hypothetical protein